MNTMKIKLEMLKEPDLWWEVKERLNLSDDIFSRYFEYGDYGAIEVEIDENLNVVGGRLIPCGKKKH